MCSSGILQSDALQSFVNNSFYFLYFLHADYSVYHHFHWAKEIGPLLQSLEAAAVMPRVQDSKSGAAVMSPFVTKSQPI